MGIAELLSKVRGDIEKDAAIDAAKSSAEPFTNLAKCLQVWMNEWPDQSTDTDMLRASGLHGLCAKDFILNYWQPTPNKSFDWASRLKMSIGTHLHEVIQNSLLGPMGVLYGKWVSNESGLTVDGFHPEPERAIKQHVYGAPQTWLYFEPIVWHEQYRISGHLDGFVDINRVQWLFENAAKFKKDPTSLYNKLCAIPKGELYILEIKTIGKWAFDQLRSSADIADYYKTQACIYQKLSGIDRTLFWFMERDTMASKCFVYKFEDGWWKDASREARTVWECIRDERLPDTGVCKLATDKRAKECAHGIPCFGRLNFKEYVAKGRELGEKLGRKFLDLSKLSFE